ncbi:putative amidase family protein [Triangularia verruculosa]|uniref:Amidase family protein n=1 Tax=Triangularia verruculosa TaxID=2587418 RepID=A0AAN6XIB6_9PEZI|nr:putative amidase family protein [Triangularia verruculosa]
MQPQSTKPFDPLLADAGTLQELLDQKIVTTSLELVDAYLAQIETHDDYLHAVIQTTPRELLETICKHLDEERARGCDRGPLHGIPILLKDNIATHPSLGLATTAGSLALKSSKPRANAHVVDLLLESGAIILGKTNLSEFSNARGYMMPSGWSAVGGQTQSAYVHGGIAEGDSRLGHSSPAGSSTGSAVAVSAGYAPISLGTETDGSLICPAGRAALYTIKPTIGLVSQKGVVPVSRHFDSVGPMTKTVYDLAVLLDVLTEKSPEEFYTKCLTTTWNDISVATLDPKLWRYDSGMVKPMPGAEKQMDREIREAYLKIEARAERFKGNVNLSHPRTFVFNEVNIKEVITLADLRADLHDYLDDLEESEVRFLEHIIAFNNEHADEELPSHHGNQDRFHRAANLDLSLREHDVNLRLLRWFARTQGAEPIFNSGVDVILGPADGFLTSVAACGGYPIAAMPLSYLDFNGRPFGVSAMAARGREDILVKVMSAWEATFPARRPPPLLRKASEESPRASGSM